MTNDSMMNISLDEKLVTPIIEAKIRAAIVRELGDPTALMEQAIGLALHKKVGRDGKICQYSSDNKYDLLEVLTITAIQKAAKEAIEVWLEGAKDKMIKHILAEMVKPTRQKSVAKAMVDAMETSFASKWHFKIDVSVPEK